jgi:hypothetical protein
MKKIETFLVLSIFFIVCANVSAQTYGNYRDAVYLKNGSVIKGIIIENIPNVSIKLQMADGSIFIYKYEEIEKFTKEEVPVVVNTAKDKNPGLAFMFSFLLPGGGQYYNGETTKGVVMTTACIGSIILMSAGAGNNNLSESSMGCFVYISDYLWSMIDAPVTASRINRNNREGLMSLDLGKGKILSLSPDIALSNGSCNLGIGRKEPVLGFKLKLSL